MEKQVKEVNLNLPLLFFIKLSSLLQLFSKFISLSPSTTPNLFSNETHEPSHRPFLLINNPFSNGRFTATATRSTTLPHRFQLTRLVVVPRTRQLGPSQLARVLITPFLVPLLLPSFSFLPSFVVALRQTVFEGIDDLVYSFPIRRLVPPGPVTRVAPEAATVEQRLVIAVHGGLRGGGEQRVAGKVERRAAGGGAGDEIGQDFPVLRRERRREGEDGGRKEGQLV